MVRFLRAANWRVEEALAILKTYMSLGEEYQAYCVRAVPTLLDKVWEADINCMLERRDQYGRRVFIYRLGRWDPDTVPLEDFFASSYVLLELVAREVRTQIAGITIVNDLSGFS